MDEPGPIVAPRRRRGRRLFGCAVSVGLLVAAAVLAQPSPEPEVSSAGDRGRVDALLESSERQVQKDAEAARESAAEAAAIAERLGYREGQARAAFALGEALRAAERFREARERFREAERLAGRLADRELLARSRRRVGDCSHFLGDFQEALAAYLEALRTYDGLRAQAGGERFDLPVGHLHATIGNVLRRTEQRREALRYYTTALEIYRRHDYRGGIAGSLLNIGTIHQELGDLDAALEAYASAKSITEALGDRYLLSILLNNIGAVELARRRYASAIGSFQLAREICIADGRSQGLVVSLVKLGEATAGLGQRRAAIAFYEEALPLAEQLEDRVMVSEIHRALADHFEAVGDAAAALAHLRRHAELRAGLLDEASSRQLAEFRVAYEAEARDGELAALRAEGTLQRTQRAALAVAAMLALLLAVVVVSRARIRGKAAAELAEMCRRLDRLASTDEVSGLPNRRAAAVRLNEEHARSDRSGQEFALALADIDDFKVVNDRFGHPCGDALLRELGELVRGSLRTGDFVARWGGDELILLLPDTGSEGGAAVAEKLRATIAGARFDCGGQQVGVTVTIGVAAYRPGGSVIVAERGADEALYLGKAAGKDRVVVADPQGAPAFPEVPETE